VCKKLRGGLTGLVDAVTGQHFPYGLKQDGDVQPERVMLDVSEGERKLLFPRERVSSIDLHPSGNTGKHIVLTMRFRSVVVQVFHQERPWADQTHFSPQDVTQLGQFVQAGGAQEATEASLSLRIRKQLSSLVTGIGHRAGFIQGKRLPAKPWAFLHEHERPTMDNPRRQCDESGNRKKEREKADGHHQVEGAPPREETRDRRLGGVDHVVHNGVNFRDARRVMKSSETRRTTVLLEGILCGVATTCTFCLRGPG